MEVVVTAVEAVAVDIAAEAVAVDTAAEGAALASAEALGTVAEVVATEAEVVGTVAGAALTWALDRRYPVRLQGRLPAAMPCARHPAARR